MTRGCGGALAAAALALAVAAGCGGEESAGTTHRGPPARIVRFSIESRLVGERLEEVGVRSSGRRRPLLVLLHGRGMRPDDFLYWPEFVGALDALGRNAPAVLLVDGGETSYYHDRADGRWGSYVLREAIPAGVRRLGADPTRVAIGGISMGGFGALDLARLAPARFCAVGGHSAAVWPAAGDTPEGAFDDAADFARHDLFRQPFRVRSPVWLDVGSDDPFRSADEALVRRLRETGARVTFHVWPGGHEAAYWRAHVRAYLRFYAKRLAGCVRG